MRRVLLKVLLIALFLNAAIGVPLHAGVHLGGGVAAEATVEPASAGHGEDPDEPRHTSCAWCLAHVEASSAPPTALDALIPGDWRVTHARPAAVAVPAFSAGLWASSPRGPPSS